MQHKQIEFSVNDFNDTTATSIRSLLPSLPIAQTLTLPETNIAPENGWLEYYFPIGMAYFQVLCWF